MDNNSSTNPTPEQGSENKESRISKLPAIPILGGLFILILIVIVIFAWAQTHSATTQLVNQGKTEIIEGKYPQAQSSFKQALATSKKNPEILSHLIDSYSLQGNSTGTEDKTFKESQPYVDQAVQYGSKNSQTLVSIGYAYEANGQYAKALDYYNQAVKISPNSSDAWFHLGHDLQFLGRNKEAYNAYDKSYSLDPNNPEALSAKGNMVLSKGQINDSYNFFKKASEAKNVNPQITAEALTAASLVRSLQTDSNKFRDATELSKQAVDASPTFSPALASYGYNLFLTNPDKSLGEKYVLESLSANPRISQNYALLAQMYFAQKQFDKSSAYYTEAIAHVDNDNTILSEDAKKIAKSQYLFGLAISYNSAGGSVDVAPFLIQAIQLDPQIKDRIKAEMNIGGFKSASGNSEFQSLINP